MKKISLIGSGNIGGELAALVASKNLADIVLIDIRKGLAEGKALDILQSNSVHNNHVSISGSSDLKKIKNSDVIIVTAGVTRKPGMSRDDLISINSAIMKEIGIAIKHYSPNAFTICVTNPLDVMVWVLKKYSNQKKNLISGMAGILDSARFKHFLSKELKISHSNIQTMVLGGHGDTMVPLLRYTSINGIPILEFVKNKKISMKKLDSIIERTRGGGGEIVSLLKDGSAFYAPAISALEMAESYLLDQNKLLPCSVYLNGEYGVKNLFVGVPTVIGSSGIKNIIELNLEANERKNFLNSVSAVKKLTSKCKKLLV